MKYAPTGLPGLANHAQHVSEVQLPLIIGRHELGQCGPQCRRVENVDAGVDLDDLQLGVIGVPVLDNAGDYARCVAQDPPVSGRVGDLRGQHGNGSLAGAVLIKATRRVSRR